METPGKEKGRSYHTAAPQNSHRNPKASRRKYQAKPKKTALISPSATLDLLDVRYRRSGRRLECFCPFHKNGKERSPSLMMDAVGGYFRCFTCGAKGGDVIAFYRVVTGAGFQDALQALEARHD